MVAQIILQFILGIAITSVGVLMVYKTPWFLSMLGRVAFAERFLGGGGTRIFYKLFGMLIAILGIIVAFNLFDVIIGGFLIRLFGNSYG